MLKLKAFLNDTKQTVIMLNDETDLMKTAVIDRDNNRVIAGVYQLFSVNYLFGYDSLETLGFWNIEKQVFYQSKKGEEVLFSNLETKNVADLNYLFNTELNKLLEIKLSGVEAKEYAKEYALKERYYLGQYRKEYVKNKVADFFYDNIDTITFNSVEFPNYQPQPYELAKVIRDKSTVGEIISRHLAEMTNEYSGEKRRYLTQAEVLMRREIHRRATVNLKRNLELTAKEAKTLDFFGKLALVPRDKKVKVWYVDENANDGKNELIFPMKVWEAVFEVNPINATIDCCAIGWEKNEYMLRFGKWISIDNIKEIKYNQKVIYQG